MRAQSMAVKLSSLTCSRRIPKWVYLRSYVSSSSCAKDIEILPENDQNPSDASEFEVKVQSLRNRLQPSSFLGVLNSTDDVNLSLKLFRWASLQNRFRHTADTYYQMILKLGMAGYTEEMTGLCNEMVKERGTGAEETLLALMNFFVKNSRLNEALRIIKTMISGNFKLSLGVFNVLMGVLVEKKRDFEDVLFVYKEMVKADIPPNTDTLNYLLEALFEADRISTALDQYKRMPKKRCAPNCRTFEVLVSGLVERNRVDESIVVLNEMFELKIEPNLSFYTNVIPIFCRLDKLDIGVKLFKLMKVSKLSPDARVYEALIECLCKSLHSREAITLLEEMMESGLDPEDGIFADIVTCFCRLEKFDEASKLLEDKHVVGSHPYNALLGGYCDAGNVVEAKVLFTSMLEKEIADSDSWNILIRRLSESLMITKALEFLGRMIIFSFVPDAATYSAIVVGNCRLAKYKAVYELFNQVCAKSWFLDSDCYSELVECLCQHGMIHEAAEVFSYMSRGGCTLQLYSFFRLIKGLCLTKNTVRAIRLLSPGTNYSTAAYNAIMSGLCKEEKPNDCSVVLSRMLVHGCSCDGETYGILAQSMISLGQTEECVRFFNIMVGEVLLPDSEIVAYILSSLTEHNQLHRIMKAIDKLVLNHEVLDSTMYNNLINGLWEEGYKSEATRLLDIMLEKGWVPEGTTHGLLMGSCLAEVKNPISAPYEDNNMQDKIGDILAEGLGET